jgi:hypothetical protein
VNLLSKNTGQSPMAPPNKETIIFLHIPKTAGMTLYQILSRQYAPKAIYTIGGQTELNAFQALTPEQQAQYRLIRGHLEFGLHTRLPGSASYFTILREPVDRVVSYYYFLHQRPLDRMHDLIKRDNLSLTQFLQRQVDPLADNAQTRMLSGTWYSVPVGKCTPEMLVKAKENLRQHFRVAGLTERFDETLLLLQRAFGWHSLHYMRQNPTHKRPSRHTLSPDIANIVAAHNQFDIALYEFAQTLFVEQITAYGPSFASDLTRFQRRNQQLSPLIRAYWAMRKVSLRTLVRQQWERLRQ